MTEEEELEFSVRIGALFGVDRETSIAWRREGLLRRLERDLWKLRVQRMYEAIWERILAEVQAEIVAHG